LDVRVTFMADPVVYIQATIQEPMFGLYHEKLVFSMGCAVQYSAKNRY